MAGGFAASTGSTKKYAGRVTAFVVLTCLVSATGGLIFGYDLGISGGVTSMDPFLKKFFPDVFRKLKQAHTNAYCKFDDQLLTTFTSSLYIAGLIASFFASTSTRLLGRKMSILFGGSIFLTGAALNGAAANVAMLILGRICLGIGVGFGNQGNQAIPLYPETPNSLVERGHQEKARAMLEKIRGTPDVQEEFDDLVEASEASRRVKHPFRTMLERKYRPQLVMAIAINFFQQLSGITVITFYAPVLFKKLGLGYNASLFFTVLAGVVGWVGNFVALVTVDKIGRRFLFITGGIGMFVSQVAIAVLLGINIGGSGEGSLSKGSAILGGGFHFRLLIVLWLVMGSSRMAGSQRDLPSGNPFGRAEHQRHCKSSVYIRSCPEIPCHSLPLEVRAVSLLCICRWNCGDDRFRLLAAP